MAPPTTGSSSTSSRVKTRSWKLKSRRFHSVKKKKENQQGSHNRSGDHDTEQEMMMMISSSSPSSSSSKNDCTQILEELDIIISDGDDDNGCSTPKGERFSIPQVSTCPPPPKKPKSLPNNFFNDHHRSPIPFFASPELELFFLGALRDISV